MKLKDFIKQLKNIEKEKGGSMEVKMADCIPVIEPIVSSDNHGKKCIIITDQK